MRTSLTDIVRFAWALYRHPARRHLRIGQFMEILATSRAINRRAPLFYAENDDLIERVKAFPGARP